MRNNPFYFLIPLAIYGTFFAQRVALYQIPIPINELCSCAWWMFLRNIVHFAYGNQKNTAELTTHSNHSHIHIHTPVRRECFFYWEPINVNKKRRKIFNQHPNANDVYKCTHNIEAVLCNSCYFYSIMIVTLQCIPRATKTVSEAIRYSRKQHRKKPDKTTFCVMLFFFGFAVLFWYLSWI